MKHSQVVSSQSGETFHWRAAAVMEAKRRRSLMALTRSEALEPSPSP